MHPNHWQKQRIRQIWINDEATFLVWLIGPSSLLLKRFADKFENSEYLVEKNLAWNHLKLTDPNIVFDTVMFKIK